MGKNTFATCKVCRTQYEIYHGRVDSRNWKCLPCIAKEAREVSREDQYAEHAQPAPQK